MAAYAVCVRDGQVLLARSPAPGGGHEWVLPGGGMEALLALEGVEATADRMIEEVEHGLLV